MLRAQAARLTLAVVCVLAPFADRAQAAAPFDFAPFDFAQGGPVFQLQNNFWVNLHQFLRGEARRLASRGMARMGTGLFADAERVSWSRAVGTYGDLSRNQAADTEFASVTNVLARASDPDALPVRGVDPAYADALRSAAPIYRRYMWLRHRDRNDTYMTLARAALQRRGATIASETSSRERIAWPAQPVLVDVVSEAGPDGAYCLAGPAGAAAHIVLASDSRTGADAIAQLLFRQLADYLKRK